MSFRVGHGFDAHRLAAGRPLMLGGIQIPFDRGLVGHSDGDCLAHAVCDAILGAAGEGDMGAHFPSGDARWKNASGESFVRAVARLIETRHTIENVDATVIGEAPRLLPHLDRMRETIARALGVPVFRVSIKAKSTDELGALGRGEGIAAHAVALLRVNDGPPD
jgi:2-C-methyl-D-erythritol 2,4-cyclodiphosphate synthase